MKIVFYTLQKLSKQRTQNRSVGRGGFGTAVGLILGGGETKKGRRNGLIVGIVRLRSC